MYWLNLLSFLCQENNGMVALIKLMEFVTLTEVRTQFDKTTLIVIVFLYIILRVYNYLCIILFYENNFSELQYL